MYWGGNSGETHLHETDLKVDKSWNVLTAHTSFSQQSMQVGQGVLSEVLIRSLIFCPLKCVVCIGGFCCCFFFLLTSLGVDLNQTNSYFSNVVAVFLEEHWIPASLVLSIPTQVCVCSTGVDFLVACSSCAPSLHQSTALTPALFVCGACVLNFSD